MKNYLSLTVLIILGAAIICESAPNFRQSICRRFPSLEYCRTAVAHADPTGIRRRGFLQSKQNEASPDKEADGGAEESGEDYGQDNGASELPPAPTIPGSPPSRQPSSLVPSMSMPLQPLPTSNVAPNSVPSQPQPRASPSTPILPTLNPIFTATYPPIPTPTAGLPPLPQMPPAFGQPIPSPEQNEDEIFKDKPPAPLPPNVGGGGAGRPDGDDPSMLSGDQLKKYCKNNRQEFKNSCSSKIAKKDFCKRYNKYCSKKFGSFGDHIPVQFGFSLNV